MAKNRNDGLRKRCGCPRRNWAKCPHSWYLNFQPRGGAHHRLSLDAELGRHIESKTEAEAGIWIDTKMYALSLKPATGATLAYALPTHPAGGGRHRLEMLGRELGELSRWFGGPAEAIEDFRRKFADLRPGPVRCWPHHFDIATLVRLDESTDDSARTIAIGASPGDEFYSQPYLYVSPWPRFDASGLPELPRPGHWHTEGFFGAVATADDILAMPERARGLRAFVEAAFEIGRTRLGR